MNTKKAVWIGKPGKMKATLHSLSFRSEEQHSVFFILGEEGEMMISYRAEASAAIMLLHTPDEYIAFHPDRIVTAFSGVRTEIPEEGVSSVRLVKNGPDLSFFSGERHLLSISKDAFRTSVSFGLSSKGEGEVSLEVF